MKKILFLFSFFIFCTACMFSEGSFELPRDEYAQSQALLFKQKRATWKGAPDSAIFYECYLRQNEDETTMLLDTFLRTEFLKTPLLIINEATSMQISADNAKSMLKNVNTVYKCVVLYSSEFMGTAIVNIFSAESVGMRIGYLQELLVEENSIFDNLNRALADIYWSAINNLTTEEMRKLWDVNNGYPNWLKRFPTYMSGGSIFYGVPDIPFLNGALPVTIKGNGRTVIQLDKWPEPTSFKQIDLLDILQKINEMKSQWFENVLKNPKEAENQAIEKELQRWGYNKREELSASTLERIGEGYKIENITENYKGWQEEYERLSTELAKQPILR